MFSDGFVPTSAMRLLLRAAERAGTFTQAPLPSPIFIHGLTYDRAVCSHDAHR